MAGKRVNTQVAQVFPLVSARSPALEEVARDLDAIAEAFLVKDVADVAFNSPQAEVEFGGDLFVTQTSCHCLSDAPLGVGKVFITYQILFARAGSAEEPRDFSMCTFHTLEDIGNDGHQFVRLKRFRQVRIHTRAKSGDTVGSLVLCCQEDYRDEFCAR